ncbi:MAG: GNAT family N-acetyltransferase [Planctomycetota bacterium]
MTESGQGAKEVNQGSSGVSIRAIDPGDDPFVADLIRTVLLEFGCSGEGFAGADPEVDQMSTHYPGGEARFYVLVQGAEIVGCGGFAPLRGAAAAATPTLELRKMYFRPEIRGRGLGRRFLEFLVEQMRETGYRRVYLETVEQMRAAQHLYRAFGFQPLAASLGATGHTRCDRRYLLEL